MVTAMLVAAASLVSFAESYRALYDWSIRHGLGGLWAAVWPIQIDVFIAVGELALFVALIDGWQKRSRVLPWAVVLLGLAVSVAGNIGHVASHVFAVRATAAVPPLAAASALAVGLGVLKRVVEHQHEPQPAPAAATPAPVSVPREEPIREVMHRYKTSQPTAIKMRKYAAERVKAASSNGHAPT